MLMGRLERMLLSFRKHSVRIFPCLSDVTKKAIPLPPPEPLHRVQVELLVSRLNTYRKVGELTEEVNLSPRIIKRADPGNRSFRLLTAASAVLAAAALIQGEWGAGLSRMYWIISGSR